MKSLTKIFQREQSTQKVKISQKIKKTHKQYFFTALLLLAVVLYVYGYEICYLMYNADGLEGEERKQVIKSFWELRFSNYSLIICILFLVSKFKLNLFNKMIMSIGFNLAFVSCFDKFIMREYDLTKYDSLIIFFIILIEFIKYIQKKRHE